MPATESREVAIIAVTKRGAMSGSRLSVMLDGSQLYVPAKQAPHLQGVRAHLYEASMAEVLRSVFPKFPNLVLFLALGAAVRLLAPLIKGKTTDPAVVVVDELGRFAISALSGHQGGANDLALRVAGLLGAQPVITTASDLLDILSPDLIGRDQGWIIEHAGNLAKVSAALVNGEPVGVFQDAGERDWWPADKSWPENLTSFDDLRALAQSACAAALIITDRLLGEEYAKLLDKSVLYRPKSLVVGIGCDRGVASSEIESAVLSALGQGALSMNSIRNLATIDIKSNEVGLIQFANLHGFPTVHFTADELNSMKDIPSPSETILRIIGARGVCEPAAMLSAKTEKLLVPKHKLGGVTVAVARQAGGLGGVPPKIHHPSWRAHQLARQAGGLGGVPPKIHHPSWRAHQLARQAGGLGGCPPHIPHPYWKPHHQPGGRTGPVHQADFEAARTTEPLSRQGAIFVVGVGPGAGEHMTFRAREALRASDVVVGYQTYLDLIGDLLVDKEVVGSGMRQELARARKALEMAEVGKKVSVVSSGDAGVYGMAGLIYEVAKSRGGASTRSIEVIPGVSALNAAAALLGAPLAHDFAVISLSDLLTPWETIERRLEAAGRGDFVVALYNPKSGRRTRQVEEARRILLAHRAPTTPAGLVTSAYRAGQEVVITDLEHMLDFEIGMLTTVIIGNSDTASFDGVMVTPRGYGSKYDL